MIKKINNKNNNVLVSDLMINWFQEKLLLLNSSSSREKKS